jgi:hypothetical protein
MTPEQSFLRRCLAVLSAALLAAALVMLGTWIPADATGTPTATPTGIPTETHAEGDDSDDPVALQIVLIRDRKSGLPWPVQDRKFDVVVQVIDDEGEPEEVKKPTKIKLKEIFGPGVLGGNTTAVIQKGFSSTIILGATYSQFANGVKLAVEVVYGEDLERDKITVEVALTAVGADARPGKPLKLKDPNCAVPTSKVPTCGFLFLKNGADGHVTLSVGSCDGLADCRERGDTEALVVTAIASLRDFHGKPLYNRKNPAKLILACDKALCGNSDRRNNGDDEKTRHWSKTDDSNGVPRIKVLYTLNNKGPLTKVAPPCPKKGVIGKDQEACVDYARSFRRNGDLFFPFLFVTDARCGF